MAGSQASEATPFFERLCPAMTAKRTVQANWKTLQRASQIEHRDGA
jgi:hypothetical protein